MKNKLVFLIILFSSSICVGQTPYTLSEYLNKDNYYKLDYLVKVESSKNILTLYGYENGDNSTLLKRKVKLGRYDVLKVNDWSFLWSKGHWKPVPISLTTVPYKVRPAIDQLKTKAASGITNLGLNIDLARWKTDRYFSSGNKSTHKFYGGIWIAPAVEELDSIQTTGFLSKAVKSKQLFISTALTINYTYNNITFTFVPVGFDFATSSIGNKWVYNKQRWWGFGIGLEPKIFSTLINK